MGIAYRNNIDINDNNLVTVIPAPDLSAVDRTPIFFQTVHEWNKREITRIGKEGDLDMKPESLTMQHTVNFQKDRDTRGDGRTPLGPAKKSQKEARARLQTKAKPVRVLKDNPQA